MVKRTRHPHLKSASAYFRIARKFERAGNYVSAEHYRAVAERFVRQYRLSKERNKR